MCPACLLRAAMGDDWPDQPAHPGAGMGAEHGLPSITERLGARIGRYKLLEQIGEGGFGVVWMAEQEEPLHRRVALKIIKPGMSPEQACLGSFDVDTRSDIYLLGVLLCELLTDRLPFDTQKLLAAGYDAVMRTIRDEEPAKLNRLLRGDLDWIVMKALEKDRRRYETANGLADDLRWHLGDEAILARPPGAVYQEPNNRKPSMITPPPARVVSPY